MKTIKWTKKRELNCFLFFFLYIRENNTPYYEKKGSVIMLYIALLGIIVYVGLTLVDKVEKKEELEKAKEMEYELYFH